jgi:hypothetical protein
MLWTGISAALLRGLLRSAALCGLGAAVLLGFSTLAVPAAKAADFRLLQIDGFYLKWGEAALGTAARIRYAVLNGPRDDPDGINCRQMTGLAPLRERAGIADAVFHRELDAAFALWRAAAGLEFVPVADPAQADIVVGVQRAPRGIAWTNVDFLPSEEGPVAHLTKAAICLNPEVAWETANDDDIETYNLRRVLAHEIGHTLGLNHPGPRGQLMGYAYTDDISALRAGDMSGISIL